MTTTQTTTTSTGLYRLTNTGKSSRQFGACEVCGGHVSETWMQVHMVRNPAGKLIYSDQGDGFGHRDCLLSTREGA